MFKKEFRYQRVFQTLVLIAVTFISISIYLFIQVKNIRQDVEEQVNSINIISKIEARSFSITNSIGEANQNELLYQLELLSGEGFVEVMKSNHLKALSNESATVRALIKLCDEVNVFWMQNARNISYLQGPLKDELIRLNLVSKQAIGELRKNLGSHSAQLSIYWDYTMMMLMAACLLAVILSVIGYYFKREIEAKRKVEYDLQMREKELDAFIYRVTHNVKSPIAGIISAVRVAKNDPDSTEEVLNDINQKSLFMNQMINDLMEWTKLESKEAEENEFDLIELVENIGLALKNKENDYKLTLVNHLASSIIIGDKSLTNVVLYNLISNAVKHTEPEAGQKKEIEVILDQNVNTLSISVADNGKGIPTKMINTVFKKFFKYGENAGSGLGLHMATEAAQKLGGWLKYSPSKEGGAVFTLTLPYKPKK